MACCCARSYASSSPTRTSICSARRPLIEVARRAARTLTFWSVCRVKLMVTFCLVIGHEPGSFTRTIRVARIIRVVKPVSSRQQRKRLNRSPPEGVPRTNLALLHLQFALVFFNKGLKIGGRIEQSCPLFVIERYREAAQSVHADAALLAYAELHGAASFLRFHLLFQIRKAGFQFFVTWFGHECTSNVLFVFTIPI